MSLNQIMINTIGDIVTDGNVSGLGVLKAPILENYTTVVKTLNDMMPIIGDGDLTAKSYRALGPKYRKYLESALYLTNLDRLLNIRARFAAYGMSATEAEFKKNIIDLVYKYRVVSLLPENLGKTEVRITTADSIKNKVRKDGHVSQVLAQLNALNTAIVENIDVSVGEDPLFAMLAIWDTTITNTVLGLKVDISKFNVDDRRRIAATIQSHSGLVAALDLQLHGLQFADRATRRAEYKIYAVRTHVSSIEVNIYDELEEHQDLRGLGSRGRNKGKGTKGKSEGPSKRTENTLMSAQFSGSFIDSLLSGDRISNGTPMSPVKTAKAAKSKSRGSSPAKTAKSKSRGSSPAKSRGSSPAKTQPKPKFKSKSRDNSPAKTRSRSSSVTSSPNTPRAQNVISSVIERIAKEESARSRQIENEISKLDKALRDTSRGSSPVRGKKLHRDESSLDIYGEPPFDPVSGSDPDVRRQSPMRSYRKRKQ